MRKAVASYPYLIWMVLFTIVPMFLILFYSLTANLDGDIIFTLDNFKRAFEPIYLQIMWRSVWLAFVSTVICLIIGYPVAYILSEKDFDTKGTILFLFLVPMWMNSLLRTYSWLSILEKNGVINSFLAFIGLPKLDLLYTDQAVVLGMVYNFLPFMILPIYTVLKNMDNSIIEAAQDLGADSKQVFLKVILPLSLPGVIAGVTMVFMPAVTSFIIPNLLGGGQYMLIGNLIEQQFLRIGDWNFGSALSVLLMIFMLVTMYLFGKVHKDNERGGLF